MSEYRKKLIEVALPLAAINLVLSGHTEEGYNFRHMAGASPPCYGLSV